MGQCMCLAMALCLGLRLWLSQSLGMWLGLRPSRM